MRVTSADEESFKASPSASLIKFRYLQTIELSKNW